MRHHVLALCGVVLLAGCSAPPTLASVPVAEPAATVQVHAAPARVSIPALGVTDNIVAVGLQPDGALEIPDVTETGWYDGSPAPGNRGPALLAGHVDYKGAVGQLARIGQLHNGDRVDVTATDGTTTSFAVYRVEQQTKTAINWATVLADTAGPELVMVTCSGAVTNKHYADNTLVFSRAVT